VEKHVALPLYVCRAIGTVIMVALTQLRATSTKHMVALCQLRATSTTHMVARMLCAMPRTCEVSRHICRCTFWPCKKTVGLHWGPSLSVAKTEHAVSII
jgi:hypothetical protein